MRNCRPLPALLLIVGLAACQDPRDPVVPPGPDPKPAVTLVPDTIIFQQSAQTIVAGVRTVALSSQVLDSAGNPVPGVQVEWSFGIASTRLTFDPEAPLTDVNGVVRTVVTVNDTVAAGYTIFNIVRIPGRVLQSRTGLNVVPAALNRLELTLPDTVSFTEGTAKRYSAAAFDRYNNRIYTLAMQWVLSDPTVATVDTAGVVTALRPGSTVLSVSAGNQQKTTTITVVAPARFRAFVSVDNHGLSQCAITDDARAFCWGDRAIVLGVTAEPDVCFRAHTGRFNGPCYRRPTEIAGNHRWLKLEIRGQHSCGVTTEGRGYCWGFNRYGQLGSGTASNTDTTTIPRAVNLPARLIDIAASSDSQEYSCALTDAGVAYCWGRDNHGLAPIGPNTAEPVAVSTDLRFKDIAAGDRVCAIALDDRVYCWAAPPDSAVNRVTPRLLSENLRFANISTTGLGFCGLSVEGIGYCWSFSTFNSSPGTPIAVRDGAPLRSIDISERNTCVVLQTGQGSCGAPASVEAVLAPQLVNGIVYGDYLGTRYCFLNMNSEAYCGGSNLVARLGNGSDGGNYVLVGVLPPR